MAGRPTSVEILGSPFTIAWVPFAERLYGSPANAKDNERDALGTSESDICRIAVRDRGVPDGERQTLLHEIVHMVLWLTGHDRDNDEPEVQAIGVGLLQVLRANPDVVAYLLDGAS